MINDCLGPINDAVLVSIRNIKIIAFEIIALMKDIPVSSSWFSCRNVNYSCC